MFLIETRKNQTLSLVRFHFLEPRLGVWQYPIIKIKDDLYEAINVGDTEYFIHGELEWSEWNGGTWVVVRSMYYVAVYHGIQCIPS